MADLDHTGRQFGQLVLRERIGNGGHGDVYRSEQLELGRDVIVKVMRPQRGNTGGIERFMREAQLASRFEHPFSSHVHGFGVESDGVRWIAMEFVKGVSLHEWLKAHGPMPLAEFVPFFECVAVVVDAAHKCGIVHRDLKPSNVMVIRSEGLLLPKLLDFGIAKVLDTSGEKAPEESRVAVETAKLRNAPPPHRTRSGDLQRSAPLTHGHRGVMGSLPYMSPEQWNDPGSVGSATDIYALGCLAREALTGRVPFTAETTGGYCRQHLSAEPPPLGEGFPPGVERAIRRALSKAPGERHATALEFAAELRSALQATPRELLRSAAEQWDKHAQTSDLLLAHKVLANVKRSVPVDAMSPLECSFVAKSHRQARNRAWMLRTLVGLIVCGAFGMFLYRSSMQRRLAQERARVAEQQARAERELKEARITDSEREQGRSAVLHGEPEAQRHLSEAYKRDPAPSTAFMLARAMQPRLSEIARLPATYGRMWWATFSPDGSQIATADDRAAQIWDAKTYRLLYTLPHGNEVYQAAYTPDGMRLVTVTEATVRIWDARTGTLIRALGAKPGSPTSPDYFVIAISPDGRLVAAADAAGSLVHAWDAMNGTLLAELSEPRPVRVAFPRLSFSVDGWLATSGGDQARVFDVRTWKLRLAVPGPIHSLAFDAQGRLATGAANGEVNLWDIRRAARLRQLQIFGEPVDAVAFSPDGSFIAAGSGDGTVQTWRTDTGARRSQLNTHHGKVASIEFDPHATLLLTANADGTALVADVTQGLPLAVLDGPSNALRTAHFTPDGLRVVGASLDGTARVWDAVSPYRRWSSAPGGEVCNVGGAAPDRRFIGVGCAGLPTRIWDTAHDALLAELPSVTPARGDGFLPTLPAVSDGGDRAAIARGDTAEIYELPGGRLRGAIRHAAPVSAVVFASAGRNLASGAVDGSVLITHDDGTQRALQATSGIDAVELLPDGRAIVSDAKHRLRMYDPAGALRADLELPTRVMSLKQVADRLVALPSYAGEAGPPFLISLDPLRVVARLEGHVGWVYSARWVAGNRILTAGADGTARLWDGSTGRLLQTYRGTPRYLADAVLTPDGLVIAGDADGLLRFWDVETGSQLWTLPAHKSAVNGVRLEGRDVVTFGLNGEISRWRIPDARATIDACSRHTPCAIVAQ